MNEYTNIVKVAQVFNNGRSRAIRIPKEFEFDADQVEISMDEEGDLRVHPLKRTKGLLALLATLEPLEEKDYLPEIDDSDLLPLDEIDFR